tara:strand:+ start:96 stop:1181 length:1086 start_codon:yes stop_codon:yes gene_type:complete
MSIYLSASIYFIIYSLIILLYGLFTHIFGEKGPWELGPEINKTPLVVMFSIGFILTIILHINSKDRPPIHKGVVLSLLCIYLLSIITATILMKIQAYNSSKVEEKQATECNLFFNVDKIYNNVGNIVYLILFYSIMFFFIYQYISSKGNLASEGFGWLALYILVIFFVAVFIDLVLGYLLSTGDHAGSHSNSYIDNMDIYTHWIGGSDSGDGTSEDGTSEDGTSEDGTSDLDRSTAKTWWRVIGLLILILIPKFIYTAVCNLTKNITEGNSGQVRGFLCKSKSIITKFILCIILFILILPVSIKYLFSDECFIKQIEDTKKGYQLNFYRFSCIIQKYGGLHNIHLMIIFALICILYNDPQF